MAERRDVSLFAHGEHRARCKANDLLSNRPEEAARKACAALRADDDEIDRRVAQPRRSDPRAVFESIAYFARIGVGFGFVRIVARSSSRGSSFMPHFEQLVGLVL